MEENKVLLEEYDVNLTREDCLSVTKAFLRPLLRRLIACGIMLLLAAVNLITSDALAYSGVIFGVFLILFLILLRSYIFSSKSYNASIDRATSSRYNFKFFCDEFALSIFRSSQETPDSFRTIPYSEITAIKDFGNYICIIYSNQFVTLRRVDLARNSIIFSLIKQKEEEKAPKISKRWKTASTLLFIGSFLAPVLAVACVALMDNTNGFLGNMWAFIPFAVIPLASLIFGIVSTVKGYRHIKNTIVGFILSVTLVFFGLFNVLIPESSSDTALLVSAEANMQIDFPEYSDISSFEYYDERGNTAVRFSYVFLSSEAADEFEAQIAADSRWADDKSGELNQIFPPNINLEEYDLFMIYDISSQQINTLPARSSRYKFISVFYSTEGDRFLIYEYWVDYK